MPTVIALDVSLSMQRAIPIPGRSEDNSISYYQLAVKGINQFLEYLSSNRLELVSLMTYSTECDVKIDFTRDYDLIRQTLKRIEHKDKSNIENLLKSLSHILATNWGSQNYCQVIVFTDCGLGFGSTSIKSFIQKLIVNSTEKWITDLNSVKFNFICMGLHSDYYFTKAIQLYQQLLDFAALKNQMFLPKAKDSTDVTETDVVGGNIKHSNNINTTHSSHKSELGRTTMFEMIERLCETNYKAFEATLKCGAYFRLECPIVIWPPPKPFIETNDYSNNETVRTVSRKIETCGFLNLSDIGSPAAISRHLIIQKVDRDKPNRRSSDKSSKVTNSAAGNLKTILPETIGPNKEFEKLENDIRAFYTKTETEDDEYLKSSEMIDSANRESLCVLLHGALKVENMAALVLLADNWYGFIYAFADTKKKSNLLLNILTPGNNVISWLGDFNMLGTIDDFFPGESSSFPVKSEKRSYSQSCVVWIKHASLQSDIQKVLRHAKKMPEKTQHFFKELNRIRRAALSIGFVELLEALASVFENEVGNLPMNANPECELQLKHAALELKKLNNRDLKASINPLPKNFNEVMYIE